MTGLFPGILPVPRDDLNELPVNARVRILGAVAHGHPVTIGCPIVYPSEILKEVVEPVTKHNPAGIVSVIITPSAT